MDDAAVDLRHEFSGYQASGIAEQVLRPARLHGHDCNRKKRFSPQSHPSTSLRAGSDTEKPIVDSGEKEFRIFCVATVRFSVEAQFRIRQFSFGRGE